MLFFQSASSKTTRWRKETVASSGTFHRCHSALSLIRILALAFVISCQFDPIYVESPCAERSLLSTQYSSLKNEQSVSSSIRSLFRVLPACLAPIGANNVSKTQQASLGGDENLSVEFQGHQRFSGPFYNILAKYTVNTMMAALNKLNLIQPVKASTWCRTNQYLKPDGSCDWCPEGQVTNTFSATNCDTEVSGRSACYVIGDNDSDIQTRTNMFGASTTLTVTGSSPYYYKKGNSGTRWIGWKFKNSPSSDQWIRLSGWFKFSHQISSSNNLGFYIQGQEHKDWVSSVKANTWTWKSVVSPANPGGWGDRVGFYVVGAPNDVEFWVSDLSVEVFDSEPEPRSQYDNSFCIKSCNKNQVLKNGACVTYTCSHSSSLGSCYSNELNSSDSRWESKCQDGLDVHTQHCKEWHNDDWQPAEFLSMEDCCGCGGGIYDLSENSACNGNNNVCNDYFLRSPYDPTKCIKGRCDHQNRYRVNSQGSCTKCPDHEIVRGEDLTACYRPVNICTYYQYLTVEGVCQSCESGKHQDPSDDTQCISSQIQTLCTSKSDATNRHSQYCSDTRYDYNYQKWVQNCDSADDDSDFEASRDCCGCGGGTKTQYTANDCPDYHYVNPNDSTMCIKRFCPHYRQYLRPNSYCYSCPSYQRKDPNDETKCYRPDYCPLFRYMVSWTGCYDCPLHQIHNSSENQDHQCVDCPSNTYHVRDTSNYNDVASACQPIQVTSLCESNNEWPDSHGQYCYGSKYDSNAYSRNSYPDSRKGYCIYNHNVNHDDLTITDSQGYTCSDYNSNTSMCGQYDTDKFVAATACIACGGGILFESSNYCCACGGGTITQTSASECPTGYTRNNNDLTQCIKAGCSPSQYLKIENGVTSCTQCPTYQLQDPQNENACARPTCGDREYITTAGNCYLCPNFQLLSDDDISCYSAQCPVPHEYVAIDGSCAECGDYEIAADQDPSFTVTCSNGQFGEDLLPGVEKACYCKQDLQNDIKDQANAILGDDQCACLGIIEGFNDNSENATAAHRHGSYCSANWDSGAPWCYVSPSCDGSTPTSDDDWKDTVSWKYCSQRCSNEGGICACSNSKTIYYGAEKDGTLDTSQNNLETQKDLSYGRQCERASCENAKQKMNTDLKDGSCIDCPDYEKKDTSDDTKCVRGTCAARQKLEKDANCTDCPDYETVDTLTDDTVCFRPVCAYNEKLTSTGVCQSCPSYQVKDLTDDKSCEAKTCDPREKVLPNGTCEACKDYDVTETRTSIDCIRGTCEKVQKLDESDTTGQTCIDCPTYQKQDPNDDFKCIRGTCAARQKLEQDANCTTCPDYETVDTSVDDTVCFRPVCAYNEILTKQGTCQTCPLYEWSDPNSDVACVPKTCDPRYKVLSDGTCEACQDYDKTETRTSRDCIRGSCTSRQKLKSDSTCENCADYYIQDNITPDDKACIRGSCAARHRLLPDGTSCIACEDYKLTDPSDNSLCIWKVCPADKIIKRDATCEECESGYYPDSHTQKICLHVNSTAPDSLTKYASQNSEYVDFFPTTVNTQVSFRIPAFKADDIDDVHPVTYTLDSHQPSSYSFTLVEIKRHQYLRDELEFTFKTGEEELNDLYSKQFTLTIKGSDHEATVVDTVSLILCAREEKLKINLLNTEPWIVNTVNFRYDFAQINSIIQETNPKCAMKSFTVQCQNGAQAPGTCNEYNHQPGKKFVGTEKSLQSGLPLQQCKDICDQDPDCTGIQRIVNYMGYKVESEYNFGDCLLYTGGLDSQYYYQQNRDAYVKGSPVSSQNECASCFLASRPRQQIKIDQDYCDSQQQSLCQAVRVIPPDAGVIYTFYLRVELESSLRYSIGPLQLNVSKCLETSVRYTTSQLESTLTSITKDPDGSLTVSWDAFEYTLVDYYCYDDPAVQFKTYFLNITNFDNQTYPDKSQPNCVACSMTGTCSYQDCLSTKLSAIHQNKLMSFRIHVVLGTVNSQIDLMGQIAVFDIMPTGCKEFNLKNYLKGAKINLSYLPQNIDLLNLIGVEAECVKDLSIRTDFADKVTKAQSPVYCSNIRGTCQLPFEQTSPPRDVQYWIGVSDPQGYLDQTLGYIKSNSTSQLSQKCHGDTGMFAVNQNAEFHFGMPIHFENYTSWYENLYENLRCFYTLNDPARHLTGLDVNATLNATYGIKGQLEHINGTSITLPKTLLEVVNVGCGYLIPITLNETLGLKPLVFHSRDENAFTVLEDYSNIISNCSYCSLQYALKTQSKDNLTYSNYSGEYLKMNSTFGIEVNSTPQNSLSQKIFIEGSFNDTDIKPRCSNYKVYMPLDITMCNSSALEIEQTFEEFRYDLKYSFAQDKQVISFDTLFKFTSSFDTNYECTNVTYSIRVQGRYRELFSINNTRKTFDIDLTMFRGIKEDVKIPFTIYGKQNTTILVEQDSLLEVFGPEKNQPPHFSETLGVIVLDANLDAIREGTLNPLFEYQLPALIDFEGDAPIVEMADNSESLSLEKISPFEYKLVCDMSQLTKEIEGFYSVFFRLTDDQYPESQLQTNAFASIEMKITDSTYEENKEEQKELEDEIQSIQEEEKEEVKEVVEEKKEPQVQKLPPPPKVDAGALAVAESLKADSLVGASTVLGPKEPPGVKLISEEDQKKLIEEWQEKLEIKPPEVEPPPVQMKIDDISRDGKVGLEFNQDMIVPDFIKNIQGESGRMLSSGPQSLDEVNMASIFDISFVVKSDVEESKIAFYILLLEWDKRRVEFQLIFEDPMFVSKGIFQDTFMMDIKKPELFVSEAKGEKMSADQLSISKSMPTQVPAGVDADEMEKQSEQQQKVIVGVVIVQVFAAFILKGAKQDLINLILSLQVIIALKLYDVSLPANFDQFSDKIQEVVDGEAINPEFIAQIFDPSFSYAKVMGLPQNALEGTILDTWGIIIMGATMFILVCILALVSYIICRSKRELIIEKYSETKKKLIWSGLIESQTIEYILMLTTVILQAKFIISGQKTMIKQKIKEISIVGPQLLMFPILLFYLIHKNRDKIVAGDPEFEEKFGYLTKNINTQRSKYAKYYVPIMLIRRLLLTAMPLIFFKKFYFQIQFQVVLSTIFMIYYAGIRPTTSTKDRRLIELNEVFIMITNYHLMCFTDFTNVEIQFALGTSLIYFVMLLMMVNFTVMAWNIIVRVVDMITKKRMDAFLEKYLEELEKERKQRRQKRKNYKKKLKGIRVLTSREIIQKEQRRIQYEKVLSLNLPYADKEIDKDKDQDKKKDIEPAVNTAEEVKEEINVKIKEQKSINFDKKEKKQRKRRLKKLNVTQLEIIKEDAEETNRSGQSVRVDQVLRVKTKSAVAKALKNQNVSNFGEKLQGELNIDDQAPVQTPSSDMQRGPNLMAPMELTILQENSMEQTIEKLQESVEAILDGSLKEQNQPEHTDFENQEQTQKESSSEGNADELMDASDY